VLRPHGAARLDASTQELGPIARRWRRIPAATSYAAIGALLSTGAPLGAWLLRLAAGADLKAELAAHGFFYTYALVGTGLVFAAAGLVAGRRADRLRRQEDLYRSLSEEDYLTHLPNMRAFDDRYRRAVARAIRFGQPVSLLLVDVDQLKALNDRHGHLLGSAALCHVARALEASKRREDVAARWGGDEFAVLMPGADAAAGQRVAQEIRQRLEHEPLCERGRSVPLTVTIGVAARSAAGPETDLFEQADRALYAGKSDGGNRVSFSS
jgi:diguanylate cyclase (GGDEF)-like protein